MNQSQYIAKPSGGRNDWWYVDHEGVNCLTFPEKPGAVMTTKQDAEAIAKDLNERIAI